MWGIFLNNLDIKLAITLDVVTSTAAFATILSIFLHDKLDPKTIVAILAFSFAVGFMSYHVNSDRLQSQQTEMQEIYERAVMYLEQGDNVEAIYELDKLTSSFFNYATVITLKEQARNAYVQSVFDNAQSMFQSGRVDLAIQLLTALKVDKLINNDPVLIASVEHEIISLQNQYVQQCYNISNDYLMNGDLESAIDILQKAKTICPNNSLIETTLNSVLDAYQQQKPVRLSELDYYKSDGFCSFYYADMGTDIFGNNYSDIIHLIGGFSSTTGFGSQTYRIDRKFKRLTGTVFLSFDDRDTNYSGTVKIYGDDDLLFSASSISAGFEPVFFDLNIAYVQDLTIYIDDPSFYGASGSRCLSDVLLYPD